MSTLDTPFHLPAPYTYIGYTSNTLLGYIAGSRTALLQCAASMRCPDCPQVAQPRIEDAAGLARGRPREAAPSAPPKRWRERPQTDFQRSFQFPVELPRHRLPHAQDAQFKRIGSR